MNDNTFLTTESDIFLFDIVIALVKTISDLSYRGSTFHMEVMNVYLCNQNMYNGNCSYWYTLMTLVCKRFDLITISNCCVVATNISPSFFYY